MSNENRGSEGVHLVRDDALTQALRAMYARPAGDAYWTMLEQRIMLGLDSDDAWYEVSDRWLRTGLVAAAAILVLASGLFVRAQARLDRSMAYENVVEVEGIESALAQREPLSQEQATLRKLTGHQ